MKKRGSKPCARSCGDAWSNSVSFFSSPSLEHMTSSGVGPISGASAVWRAPRALAGGAGGHEQPLPGRVSFRACRSQPLTLPCTRVVARVRPSFSATVS